jgi:hypothetical protein
MLCVQKRADFSNPGKKMAESVKTSVAGSPSRLSLRANFS